MKAFALKVPMFRYFTHLVFVTVTVVLGISLPLSAIAAGLLEREVLFSEADIQAQIDQSGAMRKSYGNGMLVATLAEAPRIRLGEPSGQVSIAARMQLSLLGNPAVPVDMVGTSGVRYDDNAKAFFLENPVAQSVQSASLPTQYEPIARQAITQMLSSYFRSKPVYILRDHGTMQERAARWLLRSIRIEAGQVVAILSPV